MLLLSAAVLIVIAVGVLLCDGYGVVAAALVPRTAVDPSIIAVIVFLSIPLLSSSLSSSTSSILLCNGIGSPDTVVGWRCARIAKSGHRAERAGTDKLSNIENGRINK